MSWSMKQNDALEIILDMASRYGENFEEGFARRIEVDDSDEDCKAAAEEGGFGKEDGIEIRDLWRAVETIRKTLLEKEDAK